METKDKVFVGKRKDNGKYICWNIYGEIIPYQGERNTDCYYMYQIKHNIIPESIEESQSQNEKGQYIF